MRKDGPVEIVDDGDWQEVTDSTVYTFIGQIVSDFALLEALLSDAIAKVSGVDRTVADLIIGRMDARGRTDRLKSLLQIEGRERDLIILRAASKTIASVQDVRNDLAHGLLLGALKGNGEESYGFTVPHKAYLGDKGHVIIPVVAYTLKSLEREAERLIRVKGLTFDLVQRLASRRKWRKSRRELPDSPRPPNPQRTTRKKHPTPPQPSEA